MANIYHDQLAGNDLHDNKVYPATGTPLPAWTQTDARYTQQTRAVATTGPLTGGGNLSADRTLSIPVATSLVDGYLSKGDWTTFNGKAIDALVLHLAGTEIVTGIKTWNPGALLDKGNIVYDVRAFGAVGDARKMTDGAMTTSSAALTSASAPFTSADVGKIVIVVGAGSSGGVLTTSVAAYQSATQVTLAASASTTVSGAPFAFGTNDTAALAACLAAIRAAGGGRMRLMQSHITNARLYYDRKGVSIEGWPNFGTTMYCGFDPTSGVNGVFTFYSDDTTTIGNIGVSDVVFDHMGCRTPGIYLRGNTSTANLSKNFYFNHIESVNRAGSGDGVLAAIVIMGKYTGVAGSLRDIHIGDFYSHDNTAAAGTVPYSINILSEDLDGLWIDGRFENLYGTTIALAGNPANLRARKNFNFNLRCYRTKKRVPGTGSQADIFDINRSGFTGIDVTGYYNDDNLFTVGDDNFHIAVYESLGFQVHHGKFYNSRAVIAPGYSEPVGHENYAWDFSNNLVMDAISFSDWDGQLAGTASDNVFVRVQKGPIIFGYGVQKAQKTSHGNVFYNCVTNPDTTYEWQQAIFLAEVGGQDYDGNVIFDDLGAASKLKYIFSELHTSGDATYPNSYRNNKIMGGANLVRSFYLDSDLKHEILGNTGVKEQVVINSAAHNSPSVSALASSDVVSNNWRIDGTRVTDNTALDVASGGTGGNTPASARNALGAIARVGDYMTGQLILGQGYGVQFAGAASSYLDAGNNAAIMRGGATEPFTIAMKIQLDPSYSAASGSYPLISVGRYYLNITPALKIRGGIWGGGNPISSTTLVPGTIYNVIFDWDGGNSSISINGTVEQTVASGSAAAGANNLFLGKRNGEVSTEFKGILDNVRMWNRVLTSGERAVINSDGTAPKTGLVLELGFDLQSSTDTSAIGNAPNATGVVYVSGLAAPLGDGISSLLSLGPIRIANASTPASTTAAGNVGQIAWDANFVYICTATNTWKRVAIGSW